MKKGIKILVFSVLAVLFSYCDLSATHVIGGDITYRHVSGDIYEVDLTFRRDCFTGAADAVFETQAKIYILDDDGNLLPTYGSNNGNPTGGGIIYMNLNPDDTLTTTIRSDCGFEGTPVCVQETIYRTTVRLPHRPGLGAYNLVYARCCRNPTLANIEDAVATGGTWITRLTEETLISKNNSPSFNQWPDIYICANEDIAFDHSATDIDGDSLVYKLYTPLSGQTNDIPIALSPPYPPYDQVVWSGPYGLDNLLGGVPLEINSETGFITGIPDLVGQFLVGVVVEEYRDGELIGFTRRDFQYNVRVCSAPPTADFTTADDECNGTTIEFVNNSISATSYIWDFNYPSTDTAFMSTEENPTFTYDEPGVYQVRLIATRGTDSCRSEVINSISALSTDIDMDFDLMIAACLDEGAYTIELTDNSVINEPGGVFVNQDWTITQNGVADVVSGSPVQVNVLPGEFSVSLSVESNSGCTTSLDSIYNTDEFSHETDFEIAPVSCPSDNEVDLVISDLSPILNEYDIAESINWTVTSMSGVEIISGSEINITISRDDEITILQEVDFGGGCFASIEKTIVIEDLLPHSSYSIEADECPTEESVSLVFTNTSNANNDYTSTGVSWSITNSATGDIFTSTDDNFIYTIDKDVSIDLEMIVNFDNGCVDTLQESLIPGPFASLNFLPNPRRVCLGDTVALLINPNSDWVYTWSPMTGLFFPNSDDLSTAQFIGEEDAIYIVTVTDGVCTVEDTLTMEIVDQNNADIQIEGNEYICEDSLVVLSVQDLGGDFYEWSTTSDFAEIISTDRILEVELTGDETTYYVRYTGEICGDNEDSFTAKRYMFDLLYIDPMQICSGDTLVYEIFNEGVGNLTYVWEADSHILSGGDTSSPTIGIGSDETEDFTLTFTATTEEGCVFTDVIEFNFDERPDIDFAATLTECGEYTVCFNIENEYYGFPSWDFGDTTTEDDRSIEASPCYTYPGPGIYDVILNNISATCAFDEVVHTITINDEITINDIEEPQQACLNDLINITASSPNSNITFTWYNLDGDVLVESPTFSGVVDSEFEVVVEAVDPFGCAAYDTITVSPFTYDIVDNIPDVLCLSQDFQVDLTVNGVTEGYSYMWTPLDCIVSGENTATPVLNVSQDKTFTVVITDIENGCVVEKSYTVSTTTFEVEIVADPDVIINSGESTTLSISDPQNGYEYIWSTGETTTEIVVSPEEDTVYSVTVVNEEGCIATDEITITVRQPKCDETDIFIPNAFTPNGDNMNSVFLVRSNFIESMELVVFNRWGQEVFRSNDQNVGWDGTFEGALLEPDAFAYYATVRCINGVTYVKRGDISILK